MMNINQFLIIVIVCMLISGCATTHYNYINVKRESEFKVHLSRDFTFGYSASVIENQILIGYTGRISDSCLSSIIIDSVVATLSVPNHFDKITVKDSSGTVPIFDTSITQQVTYRKKHNLINTKAYKTYYDHSVRFVSGYFKSESEEYYDRAILVTINLWFRIDGIPFYATRTDQLFLSNSKRYFYGLH